MSDLFLYKARQELKPKGLDGISDDQIGQHWSLYEGYVKNVNELNSRIEDMRKKRSFGPEFAELKRRLGFEYNGMVLHEHYFGILKPGVALPQAESDFTRRFDKSFGSFEHWREEFTAMGKMRGIGWVVLYFDPHTAVLNNHWITIHEDGHIAGFVPILVMDVWEHAYMVDWGAAGRPDYIEAFFRNVDWRRVERRFNEAAAISRVELTPR